MNHYYVYIMTNRSHTLYTGVTNNLLRRVSEHKSKRIEGFKKKYNIVQLVWFEEFPTMREAIEAEKRIKGWLRRKKISLIESRNPKWADLAEEWFRDSSPSAQNDTTNPSYSRRQNA